ncbi:MAG: hypothetical protein DRO11_08685 [Methanobacteriota archaeon]|nr:MAG: hypothetical protein DRO11_08685 [Euryarchaeota archaeon]
MKEIEMLKILYDQWVKKNQDLDFYFGNMFDLSLNILRSRPDNADIKGKKALFLPVGYSLESVVLMSVFFSPKYLTLAISDSLRRFFRKHQYMIEKNINKHAPETKIDYEYNILSTEQKTAEEAVKKWFDKMTQGNGLDKKELAIDITGGTKPIAVGVQNAAFYLNIDAYYLDVEYDETYLIPIPGTERVCKMSPDSPLLDKSLVFVCMPFGKKRDDCKNEEIDFDELYENAIKPAIESKGLNALRIDRKSFFGAIPEKIIENIEKARFIVAVLSSKNLNVYYELGLAMALRKKVIMVTGCMDIIPSDLKHLRMLVYKDPKDLKQKLKQEISFSLTNT